MSGIVKYSINGGQPIPHDMPDYKVGFLISKRLEEVCPEAFSNVEVSTIYYRFKGTLSEIRTRKIVFSRSTNSIRWECVRAFFLYFFCPQKAVERYRHSPTILNHELVAALIGKPVQEDDEVLERAKSDLITIFRQCMTLTIYLSEDCNHIDAEKFVGNPNFMEAKQSGENCLIS